MPGLRRESCLLGGCGTGLFQPAINQGAVVGDPGRRLGRDIAVACILSDDIGNDMLALSSRARTAGFSLADC